MRTCNADRTDRLRAPPREARRSAVQRRRRFNAIYAIRTGFFKTTVLSADGREQVTGFYMPGEPLGMDGIGPGAYHGTPLRSKIPRCA